MLDFFAALMEYVEVFFTFLTNFIDSLISLLGVLLLSFNLPTQMMLYVPGIIGTSILAVSFLGILKLLVGR